MHHDLTFAHPLSKQITITASSQQHTRSPLHLNAFMRCSTEATPTAISTISYRCSGPNNGDLPYLALSRSGWHVHDDCSTRCVPTPQSTTTHHALNQITAHVRRRRGQPKCGTGEEVGRVFSHTEGAMRLAIWICTGGGILSQNKFLVEASYMHSSWCLLNEFKPMISKLNFDVELKLYHKLILITFF